MISKTLKSKDDVSRLKAKFRQACEAQGLRLGKDHRKTESILAELFDVPNFNTLVGLACKPEIGREFVVDASVYNGTETLIEMLKVIGKDIKLQHLVIAVSRDSTNRISTYILAATPSTNSIFRTPLELFCSEQEKVIFELLEVISSLGFMEQLCFIPAYVEPMGHTTTTVYVEMIKKLEMKYFTQHWRELAELYGVPEDVDTQDWQYEHWAALAKPQN